MYNLPDEIIHFLKETDVIIFYQEVAHFLLYLQVVVNSAIWEEFKSFFSRSALKLSGL